MLQMAREGAETGYLPNSSDFMREFEVSRRTVARDLDFLRDEERAPLAYDDARHGFGLTDETYTLPPNCATASTTTRCTSSWTPQFAVMEMALPPSALISSTTAAAPSPFRSTTMTEAPCPANFFAVDRPIPAAAPVTITILFSNDMMTHAVKMGTGKE